MNFKWVLSRALPGGGLLIALMTGGSLARAEDLAPGPASDRSQADTVPAPVPAPVTSPVTSPTDDLRHREGTAIPPVGEANLFSLSPDGVLSKFKSFASTIDVTEIRDLPVQSHGRIKPLDSFARENVLFITGKFEPWGLDAVQVYLAWMTSSATPYLQAINVRDPELRVTLGFPRTQRWFSMQELENSRLEELARPILARQQRNEKLVSPDEKKILEAAQQLWIMREVVSRSPFLEAMVLDPGIQRGPPVTEVLEKANAYLQALSVGDRATATILGRRLSGEAKFQPIPELFRRYLDKLELETWYNHARLFFYSGVLYILLGLLLASGVRTRWLTERGLIVALALPILGHAAGFGIRVYITGFAPVTSMYGTMIWMGLGVVVFGGLLYALYRNAVVYGLLLVGAGSTLLLSESIPLILSPDMDPIVAVLRNNFWLSIHVLTISISYAAFTISMLIGNLALVQTLVRREDEKRKERFRELAHLTYRIIQLGVFLLSAGIILGGWWADYSWGRFWGWDPKETWALIADLGYLSILHARFTGWLKDFGVLATAPIAYLLVIMAWYGVNFILAAGLHSYGFSSGGATMVVSFVAAQAVIFAGALISHRLHRTPIRSVGKTVASQVTR